MKEIERSELAVSLVEELEAALLREAAVNNEALRELYRTAHAGLSRMLGRDPADQARISDLDEVRALLERAQAGLDDSERALEEDVQGEILRAVLSLRDGVLDSLRIAPLARAFSIQQPFATSAGSPAVFDPGAVAPPRALTRPPAWDSGIVEEPQPEPTVSLARLELERMGKDALEDLGLLGGLRRLHEQERWVDAADFERRLLCNLDALWSLDRPFHSDVAPLGVPSAAYRYLTEWSVPDWGRTFALAFSLSCAAGRDALRWIALALRTTPKEVHGAFVDGLALGSNPLLTELLLELLRDSDGAVLVVALQAAERRGFFSQGAIVPLLSHPEPAVVCAAVACFRHAPPTTRELLARLRFDGRPEVVLAAARELLLMGDRLALEDLRHLADKPANADASIAREALRILCLRADPGDADRVLRRAHELENTLHFLGHFGSPLHIDVLLDGLSALRALGPEGTGKARLVENALHRISGRAAGDDLARFKRETLRSYGPNPPVRMRRGGAFTARSVIEELLEPNAVDEERQNLALELALAAPTLPRVTTSTWVSVQRATLRSLLEEVK